MEVFDLWLKQALNLSLYQSLVLLACLILIIFLAMSIDWAEEKEGD